MTVRKAHTNEHTYTKRETEETDIETERENMGMWVGVRDSGGEREYVC
jgi:hypothetical protein